MSLLGITATVVYLFGSIATLWEATIGALEKRHIKPFISLIIYAAAYGGLAAMAFYNLRLTIWQSIFAVVLLTGHMFTIRYIMRFSRG
jgi:hypothetical protein